MTTIDELVQLGRQASAPASARIYMGWRAIEKLRSYAAAAGMEIWDSRAWDPWEASRWNGLPIILSEGADPDIVMFADKHDNPLYTVSLADADDRPA